MGRVLIVADKAAVRRKLVALLEDNEHECAEAEGIASARAGLGPNAFDLLLAEQPAENGAIMDLLEGAREADPSLPVLIVTDQATVEDAVDAMRNGAFDVITRPFEPDALLGAVRRACERAELARENAQLQQEVRYRGENYDLIGESPAMRSVREQIAQVAPTDSTVLILGETGTGKELVARAIHRGSRRAGRPFVAVNCVALSDTLLESELFGHERGAFTGADRARQGLFEAADHGTLFLDEAGEMPLSLQTKLLRVLMDKQVLRVGSTRPREIDVRIIAATHRDLQQRINEGKFREDLFYRLAVFPISIPPLRDRREDLPQLIEHCLKTVAVQMGVSPRDMADIAREKLLRYQYPGNVRELRNIIERAYILARGVELTGGDVIVPTEDSAVGACGGSPPCYARAECWLDLMPKKDALRDVLQLVETTMIRRALEESGGVQAEAARSLGISRSHLTYKLKRLDLDIADWVQT